MHKHIKILLKSNCLAIVPLLYYLTLYYLAKIIKKSKRKNFSIEK